MRAPGRPCLSAAGAYAHTPTTLELLGLTDAYRLFIDSDACPVSSRAQSADPQEPALGLCGDLGLWTGDEQHNFRVGIRSRLLHGPQFFVRRDGLFTPSVISTQIGVAASPNIISRLNGGFNLVPFAGLYPACRSQSRQWTQSKIDRNDTGHFIPWACLWNTKSGPKIAFSRPSAGESPSHHPRRPSPNDNTSVALLFGIRWGPSKPLPLTTIDCRLGTGEVA